MGLSTTYLTATEQLTLTNNNSIFVGGGTQIQTPFINVQAGSSTFTLEGFNAEKGVITEALAFTNGAAGNSDLVSQNIFWSLGLKF
jgi:hypothetical protein